MNNIIEVLSNISLMASSSVGGDFSVFLIPFIAPVVVFIAVYMGIYKYYRNTDKRFKFEDETSVEVFDMQKYDQKVNRITGTSQRWIGGKNSDKHLKRLHKR